ncbi:MAG: family 43 glycosylhydrolase [Oscillospiraceae bacterium]|nr:family 43 glycosylhydrolase [Oscillospiraceae bacterium]
MFRIKAKRKISIIAALCFLSLLLPAASGGSSLPTSPGDPIPPEFTNPIIVEKADGGLIYTADPSVITIPDTDSNGNFIYSNGVRQERMWMYPSQDVFPNNACNTMDKYHVFSSYNGQDWLDHGEILAADNLSWGLKPSENNGDAFMWAPDAVWNPVDRRVYFFYPHPTGHPWGDNWRVAVAVSPPDSPAGPFTDLGPVDGIGGKHGYDPSIFIDDDSRAYLYWGGAGRCFGTELTFRYDGGGNPIVPSIDTENTKLIATDGSNCTTPNCVRQGLSCSSLSLVPGGSSAGMLYHEGPDMVKRNGVYYLIYARYNNDNAGGVNGGPSMAAMISKNPLGPFWYDGIVVMSNVTAPAPSGSLAGEHFDEPINTSHGSIVEYPIGSDNWFVYYHNGAFTGRGDLRNVCGDPISFNSEGRIQPVNPMPNIQANYRTPSNTQISQTAPSGASYHSTSGWTVAGGATNNNGNIGDLHNTGSWAQGTVNVAGGGSGLLTFHYGIGNEYTSNPRVTVNGTEYFVALVPTKSWSANWYATIEVEFAPGDNVIRVFNGTINFNGIYTQTGAVLPPAVYPQILQAGDVGYYRADPPAPAARTPYMTWPWGDPIEPIATPSASPTAVPTIAPTAAPDETPTPPALTPSPAPGSCDDGCIDYTTPADIIVNSSGTPTINLTTETLDLAGFVPVEFDIGNGYKAVKAALDDAKFPKLLNKGLTLKLKNAGGTEVIFPAINPRPKPKLAVNYEIAASGGEFGQWVLTEKKGTTAVKTNIQIGVAALNGNGKPGKTVDASGWGRFQADGGICIKPIGENEKNGKPVMLKTTYFYRAAPTDAGGFTPGSAQKKVRATSQMKPTKYKINVKKNVIQYKANTIISINSVMQNDGMPFAVKGGVSVVSGETYGFRQAATAKKAATALQTVTAW